MDWLFFLNLRNENWKILSAFKSVSSLQHKALTVSFISLKVHLSLFRNKSSTSDVSCSIDKSSKLFNIHCFRSINLLSLCRKSSVEFCESLHMAQRHIGTVTPGTKCFAKCDRIHSNHLSVHQFFKDFKANVLYRISCMNKQKMMDFFMLFVEFVWI